MINATFNSYSLQDVNFRSRIIQHTNLPSKMIQTESKARADGSTIVNVKYTQRMIEVSGLLTATDRQSLVDKIDQMKLSLSGVSGNLDIDYGTATRRYFATVADIELPEDFYNINSVPYTIKFICADPFGYATSSGTLSFPSQTDMLKDVLITMSGTQKADPVVQLVINSGTSGLNLITLSNENNGDTIIISKPDGSNFVQGDVVIINSMLKQAQINSSGIDYTGRFPAIEPGGGDVRLRVSLQATQTRYDLVIRYLPTYL